MKSTWSPTFSPSRAEKGDNKQKKETEESLEKLPPVYSFVYDTFRQGSENIKQEEDVQRADKIAVMRAGSGGLYFENKFVGGCSRRALLRFKGIEVSDEEEGEPGQGKTLMFQAGVTNEDSWHKVLSAATTAPILREEEIPVFWKNDSWTLTGRPDIVLCDALDIPFVGLELKLICSAWVAAKILAGKPKLDNLRQAALYSWRISEQTGREVPFELWYTSRVNFAVMGDWMSNLFPKQGAPGSEYCTYKEVKDKRDDSSSMQVSRVNPFVQGFILRWSPHDRLQFHAVNREGASWEDTIITKESIESFYQKTKEAIDADLLPMRPVWLDYRGDKDFDACKYCPLLSVCDSLDKGKETRLSSFVERINNI